MDIYPPTPLSHVLVWKLGICGGQGTSAVLHVVQQLSFVPDLAADNAQVLFQLPGVQRSHAAADLSL